MHWVLKIAAHLDKTRPAWASFKTAITRTTSAVKNLAK